MEDTTEKTTIDKNDLDTFIKIQYKIRNMAEKIKDLYCELHGISYGKFLNFINLDRYSLFFKGEESWSYGGYEKYFLDIPVSYLYDKDWFERESKAVTQRKLEQERAKEEEIKKEKELIRSKELLLLKELKEKYERS